MIIKEFEYLEVILNARIGVWTKKLGYIPELNKPIKIHWSLLKGTSFRDLKIKVKCDECFEISDKPIRRLNIDNNLHICKSCIKKGDRNVCFGKPMGEKAKKAIKEYRKIHGNPSTWETTKEKKKINQKEASEKTAIKNRGVKRSDETKKKMSDSVKLAYKEGRLFPGKGYTNIKGRVYKGIFYQGSYELNFLEYIDKIGMIDFIERGPKIEYTINNENHTYFIDFKVKNLNIVFEIKSSYFWSKNEEVNNIKKLAAEKIFNYNLILNNNFDTLKNLLSNNG